MAGNSGKKQVQDLSFSLFFFLVVYQKCKKKKKKGGETNKMIDSFGNFTSLPPTCNFAASISAQQLKTSIVQTILLVWVDVMRKELKHTGRRVTTSNRRPRGGEGSEGRSSRPSPRVSKSRFVYKSSSEGRARRQGRCWSSDKSTKVPIPDLQGAQSGCAGERQGLGRFAPSKVSFPRLLVQENSMRSGWSLEPNGWLAASRQC